MLQPDLFYIRCVTSWADFKYLVNKDDRYNKILNFMVTAILPQKIKKQYNLKTETLNEAILAYEKYMEMQKINDCKGIISSINWIIQKYNTGDNRVLDLFKNYTALPKS